jgi:prefoldin subunit 5
MTPLWHIALFGVIIGFAVTVVYQASERLDQATWRVDTRMEAIEARDEVVYQRLDELYAALQSSQQRCERGERSQEEIRQRLTDLALGVKEVIRYLQQAGGR